jgi:hypothetical protein
MTLIETLITAWFSFLMAVAVILWLFHFSRVARGQGIYVSLLYRLQKDHPDIYHQLLSTRLWHKNSGVPIFDKTRLKAFLFNDAQDLTPKTEAVRLEYQKFWKQTDYYWRYLYCYGAVFFVSWLIALTFAFTGVLDSEKPQEPVPTPHPGFLVPP